MDENKPELKKSSRLTTVFYIYLALILLGWACLLVDEDTVVAYVIQGALTMLAISAGLALVAGLPWALILEYRREKDKPLPTRKTTGRLFSMVVLLPFLFYAGVGFLFTVPFWIADLVKTEAAKTVKTVASPDGKWLAYVVGKPAIDGPNWQLYLKQEGEPKGRRVARLMGDVDWNESIHWSPRGDVVLFKNHYSLFALRPADLKSAAATIGARRHINPSGTFSVDCRALTEVSNINFPQTGGVEYTSTLKGKSEIKRFQNGEFQRQPEGYAVSPFEGEPGG